jgi:hypothetical protein
MAASGRKHHLKRLSRLALSLVVGVTACAPHPSQAAKTSNAARGGKRGAAAAGTRQGPWQKELTMDVTKKVPALGPDPSADLVAAWLHVGAAAARASFVALPTFDALGDGAGVKSDSETWAGRLLTDAASPYRAGGQARLDVRREMHAADGTLPDLLRHQYAATFREHADQPEFVVDLTVTETVAWLRIDVRPRGVDLATADDAERVRAVAWLAAHVLRLRGVHRGRDDSDTPHAWVFSYERMDANARFSTAPNQDLFTMWSWADRVDGGFAEGQLYFLGFKHHEPAGGRRIRLDQNHWFDGKCWAPFRR